MELNRQRTVSGLALLPRSAGDGTWENHPAQSGVLTEHLTTASLQLPLLLSQAAPRTPRRHFTLIRPPVTPQRVCTSAARDPPLPRRGGTWQHRPSNAPVHRPATDAAIAPRQSST